MADWFKLHENWFTEPRLQWAIKEQATVVQVWLWCLTECCRTKSDTIGLHSEDYEMIGIQQLLNLSPGLFNQGLNLLQKIRYIEIDKSLKTIKVLKWNDFQSDYLRKKDHRESDSVRQSPTKSYSVVLEERRGDKKRIDKRDGILSDTAVGSLSIKRQLTDLWCESWLRVHGSPYSFNGAKDGKAADSLLKIESDPLKIMAIAERAWKLNGKHEFEKGMAIQLSSFASQFNRIRLAVGALSTPIPDGPYYHEDGK